MFKVQKFNVQCFGLKGLQANSLIVLLSLQTDWSSVRLLAHSSIICAPSRKLRAIHYLYAQCHSRNPNSLYRY